MLINNNKLMLITNANNIGDCCVESVMTSYFNSPKLVGATKLEEFNNLKCSITNLFLSEKLS